MSAGFAGLPAGFSFNGLRVFDTFGLAPDFVGATVTSIPDVILGNFADPAQRLTFDRDNIFYNFEGLSISGGQLRIDLQFQSSAIPEPSSLALLGFGLVGMFGFLRKRRKA